MSAATHKEKHLMGPVYSFRGLVHYRRAGHGGMQAGMVLEKELRVLHLDPQEQKQLCHTGCSLKVMRPQSTPPQWHSSYNKATPPNSAIPYGPGTQT